MIRFHTRIEGVRYPITSLLSIIGKDVEVVLSERFIEEAGIPRPLVQERTINEMDFGLTVSEVLSMGEHDGGRSALFRSVAEAPEMADALRSSLGLADRGDGTYPLFAKKG